MLQKQMRDDVDAAVEAALLQNSLPLLTLALFQNHGGGRSHIINEAVRLQKLNALNFLLRNGVDDQIDVHCHQRRPLHICLLQSMRKDDVGYHMSKALLSCGACPNLLEGDDDLLCPPLHIATKQGNVAMVDLLLSFGADPLAQDKKGHTAFQVSCGLLAGMPALMKESVLALQPSKYLCSASIFPADFDVDTQTAWDLPQKLQRAIRWWGRRQLALAAGNADLVKTSTLAEGTLAPLFPWFLPEIFEVVTQFL